jgi:hypothetical protein
METYSLLYVSMEDGRLFEVFVERHKINRSNESSRVESNTLYSYRYSRLTDDDSIFVVGWSSQRRESRTVPVRMYR